MGFYAPAQLVRDARDHGVEVQAHQRLRTVIGIARSSVRADDEPRVATGIAPGEGPGRGGRRAHRRPRVRRRVRERAGSRRCAPHLERRELEALADAGALRELSGNRHLTFWQVAGSEQELPLAPVPRAPEGTPLLAPPTEGQNIAADYRTQGLTLGRHPLALLRAAARRRAHRDRGRSARPAAWARGTRGGHRHGAPAAAERRLASCSSRSRTKPAS